MSRGKNISPEQRIQIKLLRDEKYSFLAIAERLNISKTACVQAIQFISKTDSVNNVSRKRRPRKTTVREDRILHRISEADRHKTAEQVLNESDTEISSKISVRTVRRRLNEFNLMGRIARKKPLISERNRKLRLRFAKEHRYWTVVDWSKIVFTDESKFNRMGSDGKTYVRRRVNEEFLPKCLKSTVKGGGGSVNVWGAMTLQGVGPIHRINGIMDQYVYMKILDEVLLPFANEQMPRNWILQAYKLTLNIQLAGLYTF